MQKNGRRKIEMDSLRKILKTNGSISPLILRLALGLVFLPHGLQKVFGWFGGYGFEQTVNFFTTQMGFPIVIPYLVIVSEFLGALGLIFGFMVRLSAAGIFYVMLGAVVTVHWGNNFFMNWSGNQSGEGFEYHILAMAMATVLVLTGGGKFSIDQWIADRLPK